MAFVPTRAAVAGVRSALAPQSQYVTNATIAPNIVVTRGNTPATPWPLTRGAAQLSVEQRELVFALRENTLRDQRQAHSPYNRLVFSSANGMEGKEDVVFVGVAQGGARPNDGTADMKPSALSVVLAGFVTIMNTGSDHIHVGDVLVWAWPEHGQGTPRYRQQGIAEGKYVFALRAVKMQDVEAALYHFARTIGRAHAGGGMTDAEVATLLPSLRVPPFDAKDAYGLLAKIFTARRVGNMTAEATCAEALRLMAQEAPRVQRRHEVEAARPKQAAVVAADALTTLPELVLLLRNYYARLVDERAVGIAQSRAAPNAQVDVIIGPSPVAR